MITHDLKVISELCKGCGICSGICPSDAIIMKRDVRGIYVPGIDMDKCSRCMVCVQSCPARPVQPTESNPGKYKFSDKELASPHLEAYVGYSKNEDLRYKAASGGIVTSLLLDALGSKLIDAALVVLPDKDDIYRSCAQLVKDEEAIRRATGSRYIPVEYSKALKQVLQDKSVRSVGIVGLPCHIDGIKRATSAIPELQQKTSFTIALFCKQTKDIRFTDMVLNKMGVEKDEAKEVKFRGEGWPGMVQVQLINGDIARYPYEKFNSLWGTFSCTPLSCLFCTMPLGETADISVGDAWSGAYLNDKIGLSSVLVRSETGKKIIDQAVQNERIHLEGVNITAILNSKTKFAVVEKKINYYGRLKVLKLFDADIKKAFPRTNKRTNICGYLEAIWCRAIRIFFSSYIFRRIYPVLPNMVLKICVHGIMVVRRMFAGLLERRASMLVRFFEKHKCCDEEKV